MVAAAGTIQSTDVIRREEDSKNTGRTVMKYQQIEEVKVPGSLRNFQIHFSKSNKLQWSVFQIYLSDVYYIYSINSNDIYTIYVN